jgi:hypothetical protein
MNRNKLFLNSFLQKKAAVFAGRAGGAKGGSDKQLQRKRITRTGYCHLNSNLVNNQGGLEKIIKLITSYNHSKKTYSEQSTSRAPDFRNLCSNRA